MNRASDMMRFIPVIFLFTIITTAGWSESLMKLYDETVSFRHFAYALTSDQMVKSFDRFRIVTDKYQAKVIENDLIRVTLLPDYGGRILSIIYKPTGHELLYQNPIGTVFGWKQNSFYYNYLVVYGGIFPTFPEPEHGKAWQSPWQHKVAEMDKDHISYEMKFTDNIGPTKKTPAQFRHGKTWMTCIVTVTVKKGSSAVDMNVKLVNNRPEYLLYEYWTCMTLAPGSVPGKTASPGSSEIKVPTSLMILKSDWWIWMADGNNGQLMFDNVYKYNLLSYYSNWQDMGIAYAYPYVTNNWYGVLNHENNVGIFRVTHRTNDTPGLKIWTWGYEQGIHGNPQDSGNPKRPYIELWAGTSTEFFTPVKMKPMQKKSWSEIYVPTVGLTNVNFVNEYAAVYFSCSQSPDKRYSTLTSEVFSFIPGEKWRAEFYLSGKKTDRLLSVSDLIGNPTNTVNVQTVVTNRRNEKNNTDFRFVLKDLKGTELASILIPGFNDR